VCFSHDDRFLAYGGRWGRIDIVDASNLQPLRELICKDEVLSAVFSPDDATLATGHASGIIRLWNVREGSLSAELVAHGRFPVDFLFYRNGKTLFSAGQDGTARVWSLDQAECFGALYEYTGGNALGFDPLCRATMSADGSRLAIAGSRLDGTIELLQWSLPAEK
jgi:WD40 repeat protein